MAVDTQTQLAALIAARILHDLSGPVGSAMNAVELLEEMADEPATREQSIKIAAKALDRGRARVELLREALADRQGAKNLVGVADACRLMAAADDVDLSWSLADPETERAPGTAAALANAVLVVLESAPRAKTLSVATDRIGAMKVVVTGKPVRIRPETQSMLKDLGEGGAEALLRELDPRGVFGAALALNAGRAGLHLMVDHDAETMSVTLA